MAGRKRGAYSQAARVLRLGDLLAVHPRGLAIAELAEQLGVSERQLHRDLAALAEAGRELEPTTLGERRGVRLATPPLKGLSLTLRERYALLAVRRVFDVLEGTPLMEDVRSIYDKIRASLPHDERERLEALGGAFVYVPSGGIKDYRGREELVDELLTAVLRRVRVDYAYRGATGALKVGVLEPLALALYKQGLYVIGRPLGADGRASTRSYVYAVERFERAERRRGEHFEGSAARPIERHFEGAFGIHVGEPGARVVIDFDEQAARYVAARRWHATQKLTKRAGGELRLELVVSGAEELAAWVLGWGPLAEVRAPPELRARVAKEHRLAARRYK